MTPKQLRGSAKVIAEQAIPGSVGSLRDLLIAIRDGTLALREVKGKKPLEVYDTAAIPRWLPQIEWNKFETWRREIRAPLTTTSRAQAIDKLEELRRQGSDPAKVLQQSIDRHWRGLFPVKDAAVSGPYDRAEVAFGEVHGAVKAGRAATWRDPLIADVIEHMGGWPTFRDMQSADVKYRRIDFVTAFRRRMGI